MTGRVIWVVADSPFEMTIVVWSVTACPERSRERPGTTIPKRCMRTTLARASRPVSASASRRRHTGRVEPTPARCRQASSTHRRGPRPRDRAHQRSRPARRTQRRRHSSHLPVSCSPLQIRRRRPGPGARTAMPAPRSWRARRSSRRWWRSRPGCRLSRWEAVAAVA